MLFKFQAYLLIYVSLHSMMQLIEKHKTQSERDNMNGSEQLKSSNLQVILLLKGFFFSRKKFSKTPYLCKFNFGKSKQNI